MPRATIALVIVAAAVIAAPAFGQQKTDTARRVSAGIDMTQYPLDQNGDKMQDYFLAKRGDKPDSKYPDLTLGAAICHALNAATPDEQSLGLEERMRRGDLCRQIKGNVNVAIEADDIAVMKKRLAAVYTDNVFVLHAVCMLDAATKGCAN